MTMVASRVVNDFYVDIHETVDGLTRCEVVVAPNADPGGWFWVRPEPELVEKFGLYRAISLAAAVAYRNSNRMPWWAKRELAAE